MMRRAILGALMAGAMATLAACGDTTTTSYCTFNSDCPDDGPRFCINGICRSEQCAEATDCGDGQQCVEGVCSD